jgi:hypothetical protein
MRKKGKNMLRAQIYKRLSSVMRYTERVDAELDADSPDTGVIASYTQHIRDAVADIDVLMQ